MTLFGCLSCFFGFVSGTQTFFSKLKVERNRTVVQCLAISIAKYETNIMDTFTVHVVHGIATAAGAQLVASCDLAVAADDTRFATPGVNIGLFCSTPMVALSRNLSHKHAMQMLLTGDLIDADTALRFGLVNQLAPASELASRTHALAAQIASKSPLTLAIGKQAFYHQAELPLDQAYAYTREVMVRNLQAQDAQEGINAFIDKRTPSWCGR